MSRPARTAICREGFYYLLVLGLVLGGAMMREVNLLLVLAGLLLGPLLFNWRAVAVTLRGLRVERKVPRAVCAGDLLVAGVAVTNTRRRLSSWTVVVEDEIRPEATAARGKPLRPGALLLHVPAGETRRADYRGRLVRRGRYRLGPLRVSTRFPFGLLCRTVVVDDRATLTVLPRPGRLKQGWLQRRQEAFAGAHRRERRHGVEGDFYGLRPWRSGDSRRWIHWRSSARRGTLLVRQFEQPRNREVLVLLDLWQPPRPAARDLDNVELAVSFAATVLGDLCRKGGATLHLALGDPQPRCLSGPASAVLLDEMMHALALVEAGSDDRLPLLLAAALPKIDPGSEVIVVGTRPVDLDDGARFGSLGSDPARRGLACQIRCVDTSDAMLSDVFEAE